MGYELSHSLMTTSLDILDQYALSLQGTASKMLEKGLGSSDFPSADVEAGAHGPRVRRAFRSDGGYGAVAALIGSYTSDLGCLVPGCLDYHELIFH